MLWTILREDGAHVLETKSTEKTTSDQTVVDKRPFFPMGKLTGGVLSGFFDGLIKSSKGIITY